ncbi:MAG: hypothetical protein H7328_11515 [Bdellovibrio sp.]|nr:hypothetical protein [Bdellovibrio sp.]
MQYEPGPVLASRGMKPLVIDAFQSDLAENNYMQILFPKMNSDLQKKKIDNHFSVLEKGQLKSLLSTSKTEMKNFILEGLATEIKQISQNKSVALLGPLQHLVPLVGKSDSFARADEFSWTKEIMKRVTK